MTANNGFERSADKNVIELTHDLGIVKQNCKYTHKFHIHNPTDQQWTFKRIVTSCACIATNVSGNTIPPRSTGYVEMSYQSGNQNINDKRTVAAYFAESRSPSVYMTFHAQIRTDFHVSKNELMLRQDFTKRANKLRSSFIVANYSQTDWKSFKASSTVPWISLDTQHIPFHENQKETDKPRQTWRIIVVCDSSKLPPGRHSGSVQIIHDATDERIPVILEINPPYVANPSSFFYGKIEIGTSVEKTILLEFPGNVGTLPRKNKKHSIGVRHDLKDSLIVHVDQVGDSIFKVSALFTPLSVRKQVKQGAVYLKYSEEYPEIEIPIFALCTRLKQ